MSIRTFSIGRKPDNDVTLNYESVSRHHAELTLSSNGKSYYLADCASSCGTYVSRQGHWEQVQQGFVTQEETLRFGEYKISFAELLVRLTKSGSGPPGDTCHNGDPGITGFEQNHDPLGVPVRRDPVTGEILPNKH